ncbi:hypothetical protein PFISCL1PPCAC_6874, partial [Pristionchus fissidentatus]
GPVFFLSQFTIASALRPPPYSEALPLRKNLRVGYPRTWVPAACNQSIISYSNQLSIHRNHNRRCYRTLAYSGARDLQWPHHGA